MRLQKYLPVLFIVLFQTIMVTGISAVKADDIAQALHQERQAFAKDFAEVVINVLHDVKTPYPHRKELLRQSFVQSVDTEWMAKFVLGRSWKEATDEQKKEYMKLYRRFLAETYVCNFAENPDKSIYRIKITGVNDGMDTNTFTVNTHIELTNQTDLKVDYLVYEQDKHYKVRDIVIENVSLIATHRAEFSELANAEGVNGVIHRLEQKLHEQTEVKISLNETR